MFAASKSGSVDAKDPQFKNVTMLLHGNGTNGAQNNTFVDSSTNNFTITRNGNTTQGTFTPYGSNWSNYFGGSSDYLSTPASANMNIGTGDFTYESWIYPTSYSSARAMISFANVNVFYLNTSGIPYYGIYLVSDTAIGTTAVSLNTWSHIAFVRSGTTLTCYINGTSVGSITTASSIGTSVNTNYLGYHQGGNYWSGYISNARVVKGTAVYTGNFTPSTTPLTAITNTQLLTCQSNRFIDNSSNAFALTVNGSPSVQRFSPFSPTTAYSTSVIGGSGYFDGSGDYLSLPSNSAFAFGTGDFTVDGWLYLTSTASASKSVFSTGGSGNNFSVYLTSTNQLNYVVELVTATGGGTVPVNTWTHIACSRSSGTIRLFINGAQVYSGSETSSISQSTPVLSSSPYPFFGYMSNMRVVKGTAVYTSAFTPPTAPVTAITNTVLLLDFTNAGVLDNAMMNDLETVGNAQISTSVKKYGTGSMYFDGTGDRLTTASSPNIAFGTGDFTVEAWVYTNVLVGERGFIQTSATVGGLQTSYTNGVISTVAAGAGSYTFNCNIAGTNIGGSVPVTTGTWYHVAFTRSSGSVRLFINGTLAGGPTTITANLDGQNVCIGGYYSTGYLWNGYVDDLRITKGYARYTSSFTPPTQAFPNN